MSYVGQTKQQLKTRLGQHNNDCKDKNIGKEGGTLSLHVFSNGHQFDFDNPEVLIRESNYKKRNFLEMLYIQKTKHGKFQVRH